jgi:hypothetical protein
MSEPLPSPHTTEHLPPSAEAVTAAFKKFQSALSYQLEKNGQNPDSARTYFFLKACNFDYRQGPDNTYVLWGSLPGNNVFKLETGRDETGHFYKFHINSGNHSPNGKWERAGMLHNGKPDLSQEWVMEELIQLADFLRPESSIGNVLKKVRSGIFSVTRPIFS